PRESGMNAEHGPGFLSVPVEFIVDRSFFAALHIVQIKDSLQPDPADECDRLPVGRNLRPDRPSLSVDELLGLAGLHVEALDGVDDAVRVFVILESPARAYVLTIIEVPAVGRKAWFSGILFPIAALRELQPVSAADMIHPHLTRAERPGIAVVFAGHDV